MYEDDVCNVAVCWKGFVLKFVFFRGHIIIISTGRFFVNYMVSSCLFLFVGIIFMDGIIWSLNGSWKDKLDAIFGFACNSQGFPSTAFLKTWQIPSSMWSASFANHDSRPISSRSFLTTYSSYDSFSLKCLKVRPFSWQLSLVLLVLLWCLVSKYWHSSDHVMDSSLSKD